MTPEQEEQAERARLTAKMLNWGWNPAFSRTSISTQQMRLAAQLLDGFLAERGQFGPDVPAALPEALKTRGFERAGCLPAAGEGILNALRRGQAADAALDAVMALRQGSVTDADDLLYAALKYLRVATADGIERLDQERRP